MAKKVEPRKVAVTCEVTVELPSGRRQVRTVTADDVEAAVFAVEDQLEAERPPAATVVEAHEV